MSLISRLFAGQRRSWVAAAGAVAVLGTAGTGVFLAFSAGQNANSGPPEQSTTSDGTPRPRPGRPVGTAGRPEPRPSGEFSGWVPGSGTPTPAPSTPRREAAVPVPSGDRVDATRPGGHPPTAGRQAPRPPTAKTRRNGGARHAPVRPPERRAPRRQQAPEPEPRPQPLPQPQPAPRPSVTWRGANPCATFDDFRRPYCDRFLDRLRRH
ncbi:hypothetical protein [Spongiactinospora rosea]|uniref:hypothetical protein n=1 Tax=Spongiactinospora rosea TaxID=2248750 RepID=UPI0011C06C3B|nr:hypothetical protein [Spongiactinospora rosea]